MLNHCFILLSILLFSCSSGRHIRNDIIYKDASFNYDHLMNNGMIIAGISSQLIILNSEERLKYSSILSNVLLKELN